MKPTIKKHLLQTSVSGDSILLTSFHYENGSGQKIYLQGNLHGPEIFGTALLVKLIEYLKKNPIIAGTLTIVPQANPFGVQSQTYGLIHGRWNQQTGNNWNRIFSKQEGDGIEAILARALISLAKDHDVVLDIHTSGIDTIPHIYVSEEASGTFETLGCAYHIVYGEDDYYGAFDETLWKIGRMSGKKVCSATWEASSHLTLHEKDLDARFEDLLDFLSSLKVVRKEKGSEPHPQCIAMKKTQWLSSPKAGYLTWTKSVGEHIRAGEAYANVYEPWSGNIGQLFASSNMIILSKGTLQAVSSGQEIGKIIVV